jgi:hypothetical protein
VIVLVLLRVLLPHCTLQRGRLLPLTDGLLLLCCPRLLPSEEVSSPKTINIKQYLNTSNFTVNNRHFVIKSSQAAQLDITKVFYREFNFHDYIKNLYFVRNFEKIKIFYFRSITWLKQDAIRHTWYFIFSV